MRSVPIVANYITKKTMCSQGEGFSPFSFRDKIYLSTDLDKALDNFTVMNEINPQKIFNHHL